MHGCMSKSSAWSTDKVLLADLSNWNSFNHSDAQFTIIQQGICRRFRPIHFACRHCFCIILNLNACIAIIIGLLCIGRTVLLSWLFNNRMKRGQSTDSHKDQNLFHTSIKHHKRVTIYYLLASTVKRNELIDDLLWVLTIKSFRHYPYQRYLNTRFKFLNVCSHFLLCFLIFVLQTFHSNLKAG